MSASAVTTLEELFYAYSDEVCIVLQQQNTALANQQTCKDINYRTVQTCLPYCNAIVDSLHSQLHVHVCQTQLQLVGIRQPTCTPLALCIIEVVVVVIDIAIYVHPPTVVRGT